MNPEDFDLKHYIVAARRANQGAHGSFRVEGEKELTTRWGPWDIMRTFSRTLDVGSWDVIVTRLRGRGTYPAVYVYRVTVKLPPPTTKQIFVEGQDGPLR